MGQVQSTMSLSSRNVRLLYGIRAKLYMCDWCWWHDKCSNRLHWFTK